MKHSVHCAQLRIYPNAAQRNVDNKRLQKAMDIALSAVSLAGLLSAMAFLAAMS